MTQIIQWISGLVGGLMILGALIWFGLKVIEWVMRLLRGYTYFCEYIWHRREFQGWLAQQSCRRGE